MFCANVTVSASVGLWTFIDQAVNLRNTLTVITTFNTPFVPAVPGGSTNVISFLGNKDSYILLESFEELAVASFTWSAMIFPESNANGPLFNWCINSPPSDHGHFIWMLGDGNLHFRVLGNEGHSSPLDVYSLLTVNEWHHIAVSYDGITGAAMMNVDGTVQTMTLPLPSADATAGSVMMGSRYYCTNSDERAFLGKMACIRLWNIARDISTMRMNTPLCTIT